MKKPDVLIIRSGALGDTLLLLPALAALAGKARITFAGRHPGLDFLRPYVFRAMSLETGRWYRLFSETMDPTKNLPLSGLKPDCVVAFSADRTGLLSRNLQRCFSGASVYRFEPFPGKTNTIHVTRYLARCMQSAGLPLDENQAVNNARKHPLLKSDPPAKRPYRLILHPGSGNPQKNYAPGFWRRLLVRLMETGKFEHLAPSLLLGPAEHDFAHHFKSFRVFRKPIEILFSPSPNELIELLAKAALYVGHDSGVTHLSGLLGTPTIALFKTTDPMKWHPLGPGVWVLHSIPADEAGLKMVIETTGKI